MFTVLRNRDFALLWIGGFISNCGDWVLQGALPFYVYARTGSALATGLAFITGTLPWVILSSLAGVLVDRWDRKRTMIIADISRGLLLLLLLLVVYVHSLFWLVYIVSFVEACITQFFNPASVALFPHIVGKDHLQAANALGSLARSVSRLVGPLMGGLLLALLGLSSTAIADSISYFFSALMISFVFIPSRHFEAKPETAPVKVASKWVTYWRDWLEGLNVVRKERILAALFLVVVISSFAEGVINALFVVFPAAILHVGPSQYGAMLTALGIGSIIGSVLTARLARIMSPARFLWFGWLGKGLIYLCVFNIRSFPAIMALLILSGTPTVGGQVSTQTLLQTKVEDSLRGRVFSTYIAVLSLFLLIGTGTGSVLAAPLGIVPVLTLGCGLFLVAGTAALLLFRTYSAAE